MPLTAWKHVSSAGVIADTPAASFQYRYTIAEDGVTPGFLLNGNQISGKWTLEIVDEAGTVYFGQTVELRLMVVTLDFGGVAFYVVFPLDAAGAYRVTTTVPSAVTVLGDPTGIFTVDPETSSSGMGSFSVYATWESPVYQVALPAGARFHVVFHNVGWPTLATPYAPFWTRVGEGSVWTAARSPELGFVWIAEAQGDGIHVTAGGDRRAFDTGAGGFPWAPEAVPLSAPFSAVVGGTGATSPWLLRFPHRKTGWILLWQQGGHLQASASWDNGQSMSWSEPMVALTGYTPLAAEVAPDGSGVYVIAKGQAGMVGALLPLSFSDGALRIVDAIPWNLALDDGTAMPTFSGMGKLCFSGSWAILIVDGGGSTLTYVSSDGLRTWSR